MTKVCLIYDWATKSASSKTNKQNQRSAAREWAWQHNGRKKEATKHRTEKDEHIGRFKLFFNRQINTIHEFSCMHNAVYVHVTWNLWRPAVFDRNFWYFYLDALLGLFHLYVFVKEELIQPYLIFLALLKSIQVHPCNCQHKNGLCRFFRLVKFNENFEQIFPCWLWWNNELQP